jgi:FkbM family methyltransferase
MKFREILRNRVFKLVDSIESKIGILLGKGWGTKTVKSEIEAVNLFLSNRCSLAIDIGGNQGDYSEALIKKYPEVEVHIFEPAGVNIEGMKLRFNGKSKVFINPEAVSDMAEKRVLYSDTSGSVLGSLYKRKLDHFQIKFDNSELVDSIRFEDYWVEKLNKRPIDLIKLDIEGHELKALKGLGKAIESVRVIQFEFGGCNIDSRTYFQDFWYFFQESGFKIFRITPIGVQWIKRYKERDEYFATTNYIAVKDL